MLPVCLALIDDEQDKLTFEQVYKKYRLRVYNFSFYILKNVQLAEDAASETFLYLARVFDRIRDLEPGQLECFITLKSRNTALDMIKKEKRHMENVSLNDELDLTDKSMERYDLVFLRECIRQLSIQDREILYLRFNNDLDYRTIAQTVGITAAAARKRLQYAKAHLKKLLEEGDENE